MGRAKQHNSFFTFGENFGSTATTPDDGLPWRPTRQPVVLDRWPFTQPPRVGRYTTVLQWDSYQNAALADCVYGMKSDSFLPYVTLPSLIGVELEMAIGSPGAPRDWLRDHGWHVADPLVIARDPWDLQRYIQQSRGELSVAKHGYVTTGSGWFSEEKCELSGHGTARDRSGHRLGRSLPVGAGLMTFSDLEEAVAAIEAVASRYAHHAREARSIAEAFFDARVVLQRLLDAASDNPDTSQRVD